MTEHNAESVAGRTAAPHKQHYFDTYEVDGQPGVFFTRCVCGWESTRLPSGSYPIGQSVVEQGDEHVELADDGDFNLRITDEDGASQIIPPAVRARAKHHGS